ncbi:MAG: TonB-dependent receptor, partial [Bacteroidia bacterium]|nr:TonB-dependent receptor [Bacteroidia bacterium]
MKIFYNTIVCLLIVSISFSQNSNKAEKDTLKEIAVKLEKVIVLGDPKTDPIYSVVSNKYEDKVVQPKNVADLF